jgi:hypothetical protein
VPETAGNRSYVDAGTDELGGGEVAEIVQANGRNTNLVADPDEERRDVVRPKRHCGLNVRREDEGIGS